jgi:uncharacterized protein (TIGR02118 family)
MLKAVVLLRRKPGLTFEQFKHHYETNHVPLVRRALPTIGKYVRNYLDLNSVSAGRQEGGTDDGPTPYFDVITEVWFDDDAAYQGFVDALSNPAVSEMLREDEERFLDRSIVQTYAVEECE